MSKLSKYLRKQKVKQLRLTWCDNANVIRAKIFPIEAIDEINKTGIRVGQAIQAVPVMDDNIILEAKLPAMQDVLLKPDWLGFHLLPFTEGSACVMSRMMDRAAAWPLCPRQFLMSMVTKLFEKTGLTLQVAFDQSFQLLDSSEDAHYTHAASQRSLDKLDLVLTDLFEILKTINLQPTLFHAMPGNNRFKFSFPAADPLAVADNQVMLRQVVHGVAMKYHLQSSSLPMISEEEVGNGTSLHFNLYQNNKKITFNKDALSETTSRFVAGILFHLPDLMALTTPTVNSLKRIKPKNSVGCYPAWGHDNREAPIEVPAYLANESSKEVIFKMLDATANPYYALAGLIACGIDGIEKKMLLAKPLGYDPVLLPKHDSCKALPTDLGEILKSVERSPFFREMMGDKLFSAYLAVKKTEYEFFRRKTHTEEVALLKSVY